MIGKSLVISSEHRLLQVPKKLTGIIIQVPGERSSHLPKFRSFISEGSLHPAACVIQFTEYRERLVREYSGLMFHSIKLQESRNCKSHFKIFSIPVKDFSQRPINGSLETTPVEGGITPSAEYIAGSRAASRNRTSKKPEAIPLRMDAKPPLSTRCSG